MEVEFEVAPSDTGEKWREGATLARDSVGVVVVGRTVLPHAVRIPSDGRYLQASRCI